MATRSIKLKLAIGGKSEEARRLRQAIWTTHKLFNEGVRYYMQWLMLMRQRPIDDPDAPAEDILQLAREAQLSNGASASHPGDEQIRAALKRLYEAIIPSSIGDKGDANQISRKYHSILVDPSAIGGLGRSKTGRKPAWMKMPDGPEKDARRAAYEAQREKELAETPLIALKEWGVLPLFKAFNQTKTAWIRAKGERQDAILTKGDRDMFQQALERLMSWESWTCRVVAERIRKQKSLEHLRKSVVDSIPKVHERLCEYERNREVRLGRDAFRPDSPFRITERMLRGWEDLQDKWLKLDPSKRTDDVLRSVIAEMQTERRGRFGDASDLFPWLAKSENQFIWDGSFGKTALRQHVLLNEAQRAFDEAKEFANYTPPDALEHPLWARSGHSGDSNIHRYSITEEDGYLCATLRLLSVDAENRIIERDETIALRPSGQWNQPQRGSVPPISLVAFDEVPDEFKTGAKNEPKCTWVKFTDPGTGEQCYGTLGGAKLQLEREDFRFSTDSKPLREAAFAEGESFPRAYLNITVSFPDPPQNPGHRAFKRARSGETDPWAAVDYLLREDGKKACIEELALNGTRMSEGLRVMAVDLGVRQLAACSVYELTRTPDGKKHRIPVAGTDDLFMEHRRTFLLRLPGDEPTAEMLAVREMIREQRLTLRAAIRRLSQLLSLGRHDDPVKRRDEFRALRSNDQWTSPERRRRVDQILDPRLLDDLVPLIDAANDPRWPCEVLKIHRMWERALGGEIASWRRDSRSRGRTGALRGYGGLSFWHIEELEETRKLLNAWSCHSRDYEKDGKGVYHKNANGQRIPKVVRPKKRFGLKPGETPDGQDIDERLLAHINQLKEDRLKVGADMIVMAALGFEYQDRHTGWQRKYPPCQMVLFEDLSRYRFRTDRPRSENRLLMKWSHREIPRTVAMQGEVFGLTIGHVAAEFSSKFRASGAQPTPGIRCRLVSQRDLDSPWFVNMIRSENRKAGRAEDWLPKPGELVPWEGGEWFCTLNPDGTLFKTHADLNAAQNLMRRFWRRYSETFRLSCQLAQLRDGSAVWIPRRLSKRLPRALNYDFGEQAVRLVPLDPDLPLDPRKGCRLEPMPLAHYRKLVSAVRPGEQTEDEILVEMEATEEELAELSGEVTVFFRDPSGSVVRPVKGHDLWLPAQVFWSRVHCAIAAKLQGKVAPLTVPISQEEDDDLRF